MALGTDTINAMIQNVHKRVTAATHGISYYKETVATQKSLTKEVAALLGTQHRFLVRILPAIVATIANKIHCDIETSDEFLATTWFRQWAHTQRVLWKMVVRDGYAGILIDPATQKLYALPAYDIGTKRGIYTMDSGEIVYIHRDDMYEHFDVYADSSITYYRRQIGSVSWDRVQTIPWLDREGNPLGNPIVVFSIGESALTEAVQLQHDINETIIDMIAVSRTMGFPQRYTTGKINPDFIVNQFGQPIIDPLFAGPIRKDMILTPASIPHFNEGTTLHQLNAHTPDTLVLDKLLHLVSLVTTVPTFYLNGGEFPSGVALLQAESRLNTRVEDYIEHLRSHVDVLLERIRLVTETFLEPSVQFAEYRVDFASPEVYTQELLRENELAKIGNAVNLYQSGLMSLEQTIRYLHPEWSDEQIAEELTLLRNATRQSEA